MKTPLYLLWHTYEKKPGDEDTKLIGVYANAYSGTNTLQASMSR